MATLLCSALFLATFCNLRIEVSVFLSAASIIVLLFVAAFCGVLLPFAWILFIAAPLFGLVAVTRMIKARDLSVITPGFLTFVLCGIVHFTQTRTGAFASWDEFSHWGTVIKHIVSASSIYQNQVLYFADYPPAVALFAYLFQVPFGFSEANAFFAAGILVLAATTVLTVHIPWRRAYIAVLTFAIVYLCSFIFGKGLATVLIDYILGSFFGATVSLYILMSRRDSTRAALLCLAPVFALVLLKAAGFGLALVVSTLIIVDRLVEGRSSSDGVRGLAVTIGPLVAAFVAQFAWRVVMIIGVYPSRTVSFDFFYPFRILLDPSINPERAKIIADFFQATAGAKPIIAAHGITLPVALAGLVLIFAAVVLSAPKGRERHRSLAAILVVFFGLGFYLYGLLTTYLTNMSLFEAAQIGYFDRFVSVYLAGMILIALAMLLVYTGERVTLVALGAVLIVCLSVSPPESKRYLQEGARPMGAERRDVVERIRARIETLRRDSRVYIIRQDSSGYPYWLARFELLPRPVNKSCWAISVAPAEADMYTCRRSVEEWRAELTSYDYALFVHTNEAFERDYAGMFDARINTIGTLYRVRIEEGQTSLALVQ